MLVWQVHCNCMLIDDQSLQHAMSVSESGHVVAVSLQVAGAMDAGPPVSMNLVKCCCLLVTAVVLAYADLLTVTQADLVLCAMRQVCIVVEHANAATRCWC